MKKDIYVKQSLINRFLELNEFSQVNFITEENVCLPNKSFKQPTDTLFFVLHFLDDEPEEVGLYNKEQERYTGFLQIDICTPLNVGEDEADDVYSFICGLFDVGSVINEDTTVNKVCRVQTVAEKDYYKSVVRVYFTADVNNAE